MIAPVDKADVLLALLVLLVLAVQNVVHVRQLAVQGGFAQLLVLHRQNQHPGQIHQRADVKHVHVDLRCRWQSSNCSPQMRSAP